MSLRFQGSPAIITSNESQEIIPEKPEGWTVGFSFKNFSFFNDQACTVRINGSDSIYIRANQGVKITSPTDAPVESFIVNESGISFNWIGSY